MKKRIKIGQIIIIIGSILVMILASCKPAINLSATGEIVFYNSHSVLITYPCLEVKRPDCFATARYSREDFPFPVIGQKVRVELLTERK